MVDEARVVAAAPGVDHRAGAHGEEKRVVVVDVPVPIAPVGLRVADALTGVFGDHFTLEDGAGREDPEPMDIRTADDDGRFGRARDRHETRGLE